MRSSHPYSVLHLHAEGAAAITSKTNATGIQEPQYFYKSPKAAGSLEEALKGFFSDSQKDLLYINIVSEAATIHTFPDTTLIRDTDTFTQVLEAYCGISEKDCDTQFLEASSGTPFSGNGPLLVNCFKRSDYLRAQAISSELGFGRFELFNNSLSIIGALSEWRVEHGSSETVGILEIGTHHSNVTIYTADAQIASKKIPISVKDLAEAIQSKLELKFDSAALLLFYNGIFDFSDHKEAIAATFAEKLTPQLQMVASKLGVEIDRLLISSLPPSYQWMNENIPSAAGLNGFTNEEFYFLKDLGKLGDYARNPGFIGAAFCNHSQPGKNPWMVSLTPQSISEACNANSGFTTTGMEQSEEPEVTENIPTIEVAKSSEGPSSIEPAEASSHAVDLMARDVISIEEPEEDPIEVISFNKQKAETTPVTPASKPPRPSPQLSPVAEDDEPGRSRMGIIAGGIAALLIIGGSSYFYFQTAEKAPPPVPIPKPAQELVETTPEKEILPSLENLETTELAGNSELEPLGAISGPGDEKMAGELKSLDLAEGTQEATPPQHIIPTGSLLIDSEPSGATILVNGINRGTTPSTIEDLEFGQYAVEFRLDGYVTTLLDVSVDSDNVQVVKTELQLPLGTLEIQTTPLGVTFDVISVDGVDKVVYSGTTPATIEEVMKGEYTVQFKRHGWEDFTQPVSIRFNDISRVDLVYPEGWLMITSTPVNASVFEKGIFLGKTPLRLKELKEGERTYTLRMSGYEDMELSTVIESQVEKRLSGALLSWDREVEYKDLDIPPTQTKKTLSNTQRLVGKEAHRFLVEFVINQEGVPENIEVLETTYLRAHDRLKKDISRWKFEPGLRKERPVKTRVRLPIILGDESKLPPTVELARNDSEDE